MRILVTGGAGFIGSNTAEALLREGARVLILDNLSTGRRENLPRGAQFLEMDITDPGVEEVLEKEKIEKVVHLAAQIDVRKSVREPIYDANVNILGSLNLIQASQKTGVKNFVFSSTGGAIYGEQDYFPADEKHPTRPVSPYGIAKLTVEHYLFYFHKQFDFNYFVLRFANVYGPRQNSRGEAGVVAIFAERMLTGTPAVINGDGRQTRDYVYVGDVVRGITAALRQETPAVVNIGTGVETDVNTIFELLRREVASRRPDLPEITEQHGPAAPGEQQRSVVANDLARRLLNWRPEVDLAAGIRRTVDYFVEQLS